MTQYRLKHLTSNFRIDSRDDDRNREIGADFRRLQAMALALAILKSIDHKPPLFHLGQIVATPGALDLFDRLAINENEILLRHVSGDWGDVSEADRRRNNWAIANEEQILSSYRLGPKNETLWLITSWNRQSTTALLPEER
jgi:hypothetical protein